MFGEEYSKVNSGTRLTKQDVRAAYDALGTDEKKVCYSRFLSSVSSPLYRLGASAVPTSLQAVRWLGRNEGYLGPATGYCSR